MRRATSASQESAPATIRLDESVPRLAIACVIDGHQARRCPQCHRAFRMHSAFAGKTIRCRGCKTVFVVQADEPPAPPVAVPRKVPAVSTGEASLATAPTATAGPGTRVTRTPAPANPSDRHAAASPSVTRKPSHPAPQKEASVEKTIPNGEPQLATPPAASTGRDESCGQTSPNPATTSQATAGPDTATHSQPGLAADPLYLHAKRVNEGMHRFHKYGKVASYLCVGFAIWANDLAGSWVGWLCSKVDSVAQNAAYASSWLPWKWGTPPSTELIVSPLYDRYNLIMNVIGIAGMAWISRWFFWTMLMQILEDDKRYQRGTLPVLLVIIAIGWSIEYVIAGWITNWLFSFGCPFPIPWWPGGFAFLMAGVAFAMIRYLESTCVPDEA